MRLFHGTDSLDNIKNILSGSHEKPEGVWNCSSQDGMLYGYELEAVKQDEMLDSDEEASYTAIRNAFENAMISAAARGVPTTLYVLEFETEEAEPDMSCENMGSAACVRMPAVITPIRLYSTPFNHFYSPYIIKNIMDSYLFNLGAVNPLVLEAINWLENNDGVYIEIDSWQECTL